jgi:hypothetical protein
MIKVFTGPTWLFEAFNGYRNTQGTAMIVPVFDAQERPIIGTSILNDTTWNLQLPVTSPDNITKPLIEWLTLIDYEPKPIIEDGTI